MIVDTLWLLAVGVVALLLVSAALAPLESLGWWAGWHRALPQEGRGGAHPGYLAGGRDVV